MTTPVSLLYTISDRLLRLEQMLLGDDDRDTLMDRLDMIEEEIQRIDRMSDQLALIIKLLRKNE